MQWERNSTSGRIVAGGKGIGNATGQLNNPASVVIDKNGTSYVTDTMDGRVQQWCENATQGETMVENIVATGIGHDDWESLCVADWLAGDVTKWNLNGTTGDVLMSNLSFPYLPFVDPNQSLYITDTGNARVIKVDYGKKTMSVVAGGSPGGNPNQLSWSEGVVVDQLSAIYVADSNNHRIMQWERSATSGHIIAGEGVAGSRSD